jgi:MYXO-CTERM domain-containing protein
VTASVDASEVVSVSWDGRALAPDVTAYHVYCFDLTGTDAGCIWPPEAQQHGFVAFQIDAAPCASIQPTATNVLINGLGRGHTYAMVVTAVDDAQNTGPISDVVCVSPSGNLVPEGSLDTPSAPSSSGCTCRAGATRSASTAGFVALGVAIGLFFKRRIR